MIIKHYIGIMIMLILIGCGEKNKIYYPDGSIKAEIIVTDGKTIKKGYYPNGNIKSITEWKNRKQHGKSSFYYKNGALESVSSWKDDKLHGPAVHYYRNGTIKSKLTYNIGKKSGKMVFYDSLGNLLEKTIHNDQGKLGYIEKYRPSGSLRYKTLIPIVNDESDTITLNESYKFKIEFLANITGELKAIIGDFDEHDNVIDTTKIVDLSKSEEIEIQPSKRGSNSFKFKLIHHPDEGDSINLNGITRSNNFYVK